MSLKNSARRFGNSVSSTPSLFARWSARSLRLRLMLWYGALLLLGLGCFALFVLLFASNAINENVRSAIRGVTQITMNNLNRSLSPQSPYWPGHLAPETLDNYSSPGIIVEVFDQNGTVLYSSDVQNSLDLNPTTWQQLTHSSTPLWYMANVDGNQAMVEVSAIYLPGSTHAGQKSGSDMIGALLVAKSLYDANATLSALRGLLLLTGALVLVLFFCCGWAVVGYALRPLSEL